MLKPYVIFDLDGTLSDASHRHHHIVRTDGKPKDWDSFNRDSINDQCHAHIALLLDGLVSVDIGHSLKIVILTGRCESTREQTVAWLAYHEIAFDKLIMRPIKDHTEDHILKPILLQKHGIQLDEIFMVFEDRKRVVDMWRKNGIPCLHVADGNF